MVFFFFFQAEDGIRDGTVTGVQTCALPICLHARSGSWPAMGDPAQNAEAYRHVSPRSYLAAWQPPVLLVQGTSDHTIPAEHTQATFDALQRAGVRSRLLWIPGADHDLVGGDLVS